MECRLPPDAIAGTPAFSFQFRKVAALPRLAWCARVSGRTGTVTVEHGPWVEARESFFVEGAWDGPFDAGGLDEAAVILGSGGYIKNGEAVFCTTSHTMERLQSVAVSGDLFISNSFAYLLTATGDSVDMNYRFYERDFMTFLNGRSKATRTIRTRLKRKVRLYYGEKIHIDRHLRVRVEPFPNVPSFNTYDSYVAVVNDLVSRLHDNATAKSRLFRYEPLATLSSGYDSPACSVFAKNIGCKEAITFVEARKDYYGSSSLLKDAADSGEHIADYLEINVKPFRRDAWHARRDFPEAEFLATGSGGDDAVIASAEQCLTGKVLFTGFLGDTLWGLDAVPEELDASTDYAYKFPAGGTLGEFRIRVGFVHLPIPLLTLTRHADMHRISHSEEMRPWRTGAGKYDRPVPRRLVETSGVPRAIYAQEKKAITQPFWLAYDSDTIKKMMSPHSHESLAAYASSNEVLRQLSITSRIKMKWAPFAVPVAPLFNWYCLKLASMLRLHMPRQFYTGPFRASVLFSTLSGFKFHWAVEKTASRYRASRYGRERCSSPWLPRQELTRGKTSSAV